MRIVIAACLALSITGCTAQSSSSKNFKGAEKSVADVIGDLSDNASRLRASDTCSKVLSARFQKAVAADSSCVSEVKKAFKDADEKTLDVDDVTISGTAATAVVSTKDRDNKTTKRTFKLVKQDGSWRIDSFG